MPGLLTGIQSSSLIIKVFLILTFICELIMMIWEIVLNNRMRKLKIKGFEKKTEEEKRRLHSKKIGLLGLGSALLWLLILVIAVAASSGRTCEIRHALELGVCVPCKEPLCEACHKDSEVCQECPTKVNDTAMFTSERGQCLMCDFGCLECTDDGAGGGKCTKCDKNFYLSNGKTCKPCMKGCN